MPDLEKTTASRPPAAAVIASTIEIVCSDGNSNPRHVAQDVISELFAAGYRIVEAEANAE